MPSTEFDPKYELPIPVSVPNEENAKFARGKERGKAEGIYGSVYSGGADSPTGKMKLPSIIREVFNGDSSIVDVSKPQGPVVPQV